MVLENWLKCKKKNDTELMYSVVTRVDNIVLYTSKFFRVDLKRYTHTHTHTQLPMFTICGDGCVHYLDLDNNFITYKYMNSSFCTF